MSAYARLFLARGDVPGHDGQRMLSEESFDAWIEQRVVRRRRRDLRLRPVDRGRRRGHMDRALRRDGRLHGAVRGLAGRRARVHRAAERLRRGSARLVRSAFACVRAALAGEELPEPWSPPAPTTIANAADYAGTYTGEDGRVFEVEAEREGLRLDAGPVTVVLERDPLAGAGRRVPRAARGARAVRARVRTRRRRHASWRRSTAARGSGRSATRARSPSPVPEEWLRYTGFYRSDDPWAPTLRVVARKGALAISWPNAASDDAEDEELVPLADGWFAAGDRARPATDPVPRQRRARQGGRSPSSTAGRGSARSRTETARASRRARGTRRTRSARRTRTSSTARA